MTVMNRGNISNIKSVVSGMYNPVNDNFFMPILQ